MGKKGGNGENFSFQLALVSANGMLLLMGQFHGRLQFDISCVPVQF